MPRTNKDGTIKWDGIFGSVSEYKDGYVISYYATTDNKKFPTAQELKKNMKYIQLMKDKGVYKFFEISPESLLKEAKTFGKAPAPKPLTDKEARKELAGFEQRITTLEKELTESRDKLDKIKAILA